VRAGTCKGVLTASVSTAGRMGRTAVLRNPVHSYEVARPIGPQRHQEGSTTAITATITYDAATKKAVLDPSDNLEREATYKTVVTGGAKDI
jgi:hypothetical protein